MTFINITEILMSGPGLQIAEAKAPWVMFERRAVEDRAESIKQGRYVAKDVDFVLITPHGSKDQIERVADEWLGSMDREVKSGRLPEEWARRYRTAYESWKEGKGIPLDGTPIVNWPVVSPAQVAMLQGLKILTVESLASANEQLMGRLGMGGRALVEKAKDFLRASDGPGKIAQEMEALRQRVTAAEAQNKTTREQLTALQTENQFLRGGANEAQTAAAGDGLDFIKL
jgi:hypothetical protein